MAGDVVITHQVTGADYAEEPAANVVVTITDNSTSPEVMIDTDNSDAD